jgi:hypothetical protein
VGPITKTSIHCIYLTTCTCQTSGHIGFFVYIQAKVLVAKIPQHISLGVRENHVTYDAVETAE